MDNQRLGICLIGAGAMGAQHANSWLTVEGAHLVAVADVDTGRVSQFVEEYGFTRWSADYREVIALDEVDVVSICTPAFYHPEVAVFAAQHGKDILCEKPMALTLEGADQMIEAAHAHGVKLSIGFQLRRSSRTEELRKLIQGGEIGRPVMFRRNASAPIRTTVGKPAMHDMRKGNGGPVVDICCHFFDLLRAILNAEPARVTARGFTFAKGRKELREIEEVAPDTAAIIVEYSSGDLGVMTITWGLPPGAHGGNMEDILGPEGAMLFNSNEISVIKEGGETRMITCHRENEKAKEIRCFAQAILEDTALDVTGEDGRIALRVSLAALECMKTGEPVSLS